MTDVFNTNGGKLYDEGQLTSPTQPTVVSVLATSTDVLAANNNLVYALFVNDSDTKIYLMVDGNTATTAGIPLAANGGFYEMTLAAGNVSVKAIKAIAAAAGGKNLNIVHESA